jgi:hypothetical protein
MSDIINKKNYSNILYIMRRIQSDTIDKLK